MFWKRWVKIWPAPPLKLASIYIWVYGGSYETGNRIYIEISLTAIKNINKNKNKLDKVLFNNNVNGERLRKWSVIEFTLFVQFRSLIRNTGMHSYKNCNGIPMPSLYLANYSKSGVPPKPIYHYIWKLWNICVTNYCHQCLASTISLKFKWIKI